MTIAIVIAIAFVINMYYKPDALNAVTKELLNWSKIMMIMTVGVGMINVIMIHGRRVVQRRDPKRWPFSLLLLALGAIMWITYFQTGQSDNWFTKPYFEWFIMPAESTMYSLQFLLFVWISFKRFKVSNLETLIFFLSAVLTLFGATWLYIFAPPLFEIGSWVYNFPAAGAARGLTLALGLAELAFFIRVIRGLESGYLGLE
jgi:predicted membrane protein